MKLFKFLRILLIILFITSLNSCKSKETGVSISNDVLVQLYDDQSIMALEKEFSEYSLKNKKVVSRPMHIFLFEYNENKISDTTLIHLLKTSNLVKEAQQNRDVTLRNN